MAYVYILSDYEEDGAEHVCATLDRSQVVAMLQAHDFPHALRFERTGQGWQQRRETDEERRELDRLLAEPDEHLAARTREYGGNDLTRRGVTLHVVKLFEG